MTNQEDMDWVEGIGLLAGVLTLSALNDWDNFFIKFESQCRFLRNEIFENLSNSGFPFTMNSQVTMITYGFQEYNGFKGREIRTLLIIRMLTKGYLLSTTIYPSLAHTVNEIKQFSRHLSVCLAELKLDIDLQPLIARDELKECGPTESGFTRTQKL